ncbi:MAG: hypothetical protein ACRENO_06335 [Thermodesulfobacteriota bacterium]
MKKYLIIFILALSLTTVFVFSDEHSEENNAQPPKPEKVEKKADCKKMCVERDGYGKCIKFEEKCE